MTKDGESRPENQIGTELRGFVLLRPKKPLKRVKTRPDAANARGLLDKSSPLEKNGLSYIPRRN
ncbi:MAG: hypothetical protein CL917_05895 [Deltaproteobacteria bacterium]|nr:hypothetical protein [Deltaproteobacteria bacterium]